MEKIKIKAVLYPKIYSNGTQPIFIRITQNRKSRYISVGYSIPKEAWNIKEVWEHKPSISENLKKTLSNEELKALRVKYNNIILLPNAVKINQDIRNKIAEIEKQQKKLEVYEKRITPEILKNKTQKTDLKDIYRIDFLEFIKKVATDKFQRKQIRTSEKYLVVYKKLLAFNNNKPLPIEKLTTSFISEFEKYLKNQKCHNNYIHTNLKALRTIVKKEAISTDKIMNFTENPFEGFSMPKVIPSNKEKLTIEEIQRLEEVDLNKESILFHYRNAWLFSLYNAGIRAGDLMQLRWININNEGRLEYVMDKTGKKRSIKLLPQSLNILKYYKVKNLTDYIFPFLNNNSLYSKLITNEDKEKTSPELLAELFKKIESNISMYNRGLKIIALKANIKKNLCSHNSRHSFADLARKKENISIYDISQMLGHSDIKVTSAYLKSFDIETMDKAMNDVFNK